MKTMYIGSGDITALLSGIKTKTHATLLRRFVSDVKPIYNAYNSPIDALRTGQILEDRFALFVSDEYYSQVYVVSEEMDVFKASLDFAKFENGKVVDFIELKTKSFNDFLELESMNDKELLTYVKKKHKNNYNQIQEQLMCTGLNEASLVFLVVYTYDDDINKNRIIKDTETKTIRIKRDNVVIEKIMSRGLIFQKIKNVYK